MIEIPGIGVLEKDQFDDWLRSKPIQVDVLDGMECEFILEDYEDDENQKDFHDAINDFLNLNKSSLESAQDYIFKYYQDVFINLDPDDSWYVLIDKPEHVWKHIQFGDNPMVTRRYYGDKKVYISLECSCDWEREHGLQIVFKQGLLVNKVGPFNGHLTTSDAYADESLEHVIYK